MKTLYRNGKYEVMKVVVKIDLTRDEKLMAFCKTDPHIAASLRIFNTMDEDEHSDTYLLSIGRQLFARSAYAKLILDFCGRMDRDTLIQCEALLFAFETTQAAACLLRLASDQPHAIYIE